MTWGVLGEEFWVRVFRPCVRALVASHSSVAEFRGGPRIHELAVPFAPVFGYAECARDIEVPDECGLSHAFLHARVLAEMVDDVGCFGYVLLNVLGMPFAVLHARNVVVARTRKIIVERDDRAVLRLQAVAEV